PAVHRFRAARRPDAAPVARRPRASRAQGNRLRRPDRARPRGGACRRRRAPRSEAREPVRHTRRADQDSRFRARETAAFARGNIGVSVGCDADLSRHGAGAAAGTVTYMSPEQVRGQAADARSDLFALGAILYEMVTGRRAFGRNTPADTMTAILSEDPPELTRLAVAPGPDRIVR